MLLSALLLTVPSCSNVESDNSNFELEKLDIPNPEPILEISQDAEGMFNIIGKSLFFRLYDDGLLEYEFPDNNKMVKGKTHYNIEDIKSSKQIRLSDEKLQKFKNLLKTQDFHQVENQYKHRCCCTDTSVNVDIRIKIDGFEKNIVLRFCDLSEIKNPQPRYVPNYPQVLSDLLILADNVRVK